MGDGRTKRTPDLTVVFVEREDTLEVIDSLKIDITSLRDLVKKSAVGRGDPEDTRDEQIEEEIEIMTYFGIVLLDPSNASDLCKARKGHRVVPQGIFISRKSML